MLNLFLPLGELILARRPGAHLQPDTICTRLLGGQGTRTQTNTLFGASLVFFSTRTVRRLTEVRSWSAEAVADMGMDTVENRGNDEGQATKGCCWREERTHLERCPVPTANRHRDLLRRKRERKRFGSHEHVG